MATSQGSLCKSWRLHRPVWAGTSANFELSRKNKAKIEEVKELCEPWSRTESYLFLNLTNASTITATLFSLPTDTVFRLIHSGEQHSLGADLGGLCIWEWGGCVCKLTKRGAPRPPGPLPCLIIIASSSRPCELDSISLKCTGKIYLPQEVSNSSRHQNKKEFLSFLKTYQANFVLTWKTVHLANNIMTKIKIEILSSF